MALARRCLANALPAMCSMRKWPIVAAEAALRDAEADLAMPEGRNPQNAYCLRSGMRPIAANVGMLVEGASVFGGHLPYDRPANMPRWMPIRLAWPWATKAPKGAPWWVDDKRAVAGTTISKTKPLAVNDQCSTFTGGVPWAPTQARRTLTKWRSNPSTSSNIWACAIQRPLFHHRPRLRLTEALRRGARVLRSA